MVGHSVYIVLICFLYGRTVSAQGETCVSERPGVCQTIDKCGSLLQLLQLFNRGQVDKGTALPILRRAASVCPPVNGQLQVCCPGAREMVELPRGRCGFVLEQRVINGENASIGQFPWIASILYSGIGAGTETLEHGCGGTLITRRHVLTAAHCVTFLTDVTPAAVRLGEVNFETRLDCFVEDPTVCADLPVDVGIRSIIPHPDFINSRGLALPNDIAIVELERSVDFTSFITPICLPERLEILPNGTDATVNGSALVAGWGGTTPEGSTFVPYLQFATVTIQHVADCEVQFNQRTGGLSRRLCAGGGVLGTDTCRGDSGGPLMLPVAGGRWYQTGISSFGAQRCGRVAGYTRVHEFLPWILETIQDQN